MKPLQIFQQPAAAPAVTSSRLLKTFSFTIYMITAIVVSVFPLYYSSLGYSKLQIGTLYSIGPAVGIFANLFWGFLSDKLRTIKYVILTVLAGQLIAFLIMFQVDAFSFMIVIVTAFYFFQTPVQGLMDSQTLLTVKHTGESYASYRIWGSLGFSFASVLFGLLLSRFGEQIIVYLAVGTVMIALLLCLKVKDSDRGPQTKDFSGLRQVILSQKFIFFLIFIFFIAASARTNDGFLAVYMLELGADPSLVGYSWMVGALSEIPFFFLVSKYGHRFKPLALLSFAGIVFAIRFFLMVFIDNPVWVVALQLLHGLSFGILFITAVRLLVQLVPDQFRASGQAVFNVVWAGMAGLFGGTIGGKVFDVWGGQPLFLFASGLACIASLGFLMLHFTRKLEA
ncbi:MFS transporter [Paenibacillus senegalensis]|uniref:MFS transporter n=1 Tax=Paenibacillus senegalensis TaxID=1465766 RepID=UPI0002897783|nr:MFS transporter [Paenibacillus senegalensis]